MKKAIVIGASSGIGFELSKILSRNDYEVGVVGRRTSLLLELKSQLKNKCYIKTIDITKTDESILLLYELIKEMGGLDLLVISAGTGYINHDLDLSLEMKTIDVNVIGFTTVAHVGMQFFIKQGYGHLVGISSIAALIGGQDAPAYNASKAFVTNYLKGLRLSVKSKSIFVTDIQPGFVDTEMAKGEGLFWVTPKEKAALQIFHTIQKKKKHAYISKRWRLVAWVVKLFF